MSWTAVIISASSWYGFATSNEWACIADAPISYAKSEWRVHAPYCMSQPQTGDTLDHYQIENLVARSGMASIFRAKDLDNGRQVAIKFPHPEMEADPVTFDRFKREQDIGESLDHPAVMKVFTDPK